MDTETAFDPALWRKIADQGWTGMIFPEEYGGFGMGMVEMAATLEEMGRALLPGPFFSTVLMAGALLEARATTARSERYLGAICRGEAKSTVALLEESASWSPDAVQMKVRASGGDYILDGQKLFVPDAAIADFMIVVARLDGELALFLVPAKTAGCALPACPPWMLTRKLYEVTFDGVTVSARTCWREAMRAQRRVGPGAAKSRPWAWWRK